MTLAELDHINQLIADRRNTLEAFQKPSTADFDDQDAEAFPEVEDLLTRSIAVYQEMKRKLLGAKIQEIEATLIEKYNLGLTSSTEASN